MSPTKRRRHLLSATAITAILLLLGSMLTFTPPASAQAGEYPRCKSSGPLTDSDGDGYGWENQQTCIVRWVSTDLPKSLTPKPFSLTEGKSVDDPLHWHFGRVAGLSAGPLGPLMAADGTVETEFNNFGDDEGTTRVFRDASGTEWVLQPPALSRFHQPEEVTAEWDPVSSIRGALLGLTEPATPDLYPMRKFVTRPTGARGYSFELVLQPDDLGTFPFTYNNQKVLPGNLGGTFNYSDASVSLGVLHYTRDIVPHEHVWFGIFSTRPGAFYQPLASDDHVIRPQLGESSGAFRLRTQRIVDNFLDIGKAARGEFGFFDPTVSHDLQWARGTDGVVHYMLRPPGGGDFFDPVIPVRPELNHVIEAYYRFNFLRLAS